MRKDSWLENCVKTCGWYKFGEYTKAIYMPPEVYIKVLEDCVENKISVRQFFRR